jgi:hypothetical protein
MHDKFQKLPETYSRVYAALDATVASQTCLASSEAMIQRALTEFRTRVEDPEALQQLTDMSVELQALRVAAMRGDMSNRVLAREQLSAMAQRWIGRLPIH